MKNIFIILLLLTASSSYSQNTSKDKANRLLPLTHVRQMSPINKNFDVIKIMSSYSCTPDAPVKNRFSHSFQLQFLKPKPYFRRSLVSVTFGGSIGFKKTSFANTKLIFSNNELTAFINTGNTAKYAKQRIGHIGLVVMTVIRLSPSFTLLSGASLQWNMFSRYKEYPESGKSIVTTRNIPSINRWSVPLQAQLSWSKNQFISWGCFYSYDTRPLYKGAAFKNLKQQQLGISLALIL
jgi:hypothetical protein